jgi:cephalosporin hydroxylase
MKWRSNRKKKIKSPPLSGGWLSSTSMAIETIVADSRHFLTRAIGLRARSDQRFVPISERSWISDLALSHQLILAIQDSKWKGLGWKDIANVKDPFSLSLYPLLIWELKPATIIELGAYKGGSALWMADLLDSMGIDGHIYSYEINTDLIEAEHKRISFVQMDLRRIEQQMDNSFLEQLPHPWLLIEDAHANTNQTIRCFNTHMISGDYLIMEDTIFEFKGAMLRSFSHEFGDQYMVDTRFTDMFGYNATWNVNGFLRKC